MEPLRDMLDRRRFLSLSSGLALQLAALARLALASTGNDGISMHPGSQSFDQSGKVHTAPRVIAFDIYGTTIDPEGMAEHLKKAFGAQANEAARVWREKQIEFSALHDNL